MCRQNLLHRELNEECQITVNSLEQIGTITFEFIDDPPLLEVHLFRSDTYSGEPTETEGYTVSTLVL